MAIPSNHAAIVLIKSNIFGTNMAYINPIAKILPIDFHVSVLIIMEQFVPY